MAGATGHISEDPAPESEVARIDDAFTPIFRAVSTPRQRRGIRLEAIYWQSLKLIADAQHQTLGETVENATEGAPGVSNLASVLRVRVARWLSERVRTLEAMTRLDSIGPMVHASPTPTFVITADKRIVLYNRPLLNLIQARFPNARPDIVYKGLRLSIDTQIDQVIERLRRGEASVLTTGFAIGIEGQRMRGLVNFVLAPVHQQAMVIAFVTEVAEAGGAEPPR